jgi:hypothetical protein
MKQIAVVICNIFTNCRENNCSFKIIKHQAILIHSVSLLYNIFGLIIMQLDHVWDRTNWMQNFLR